MYRGVMMSVLAIVLTGCVTASSEQKPQPDSASQPAPGSDPAVEVMNKAKATVEKCRASFSESAIDAMARANCFNNADTLFSNFARYPDLVDKRIAKRTELAKKMADSKITRAQAVAQFNAFNLALVREEVRRLKTRASAQDQQRAAAEGAALF